MLLWILLSSSTYLTARAWPARSMVVCSAEHDPHQVDGIPGAKLVHDAGAMDFDRPDADAEIARGGLVGHAESDLIEHFEFSSRQQFASGKLRRHQFDFPPIAAAPPPRLDRFAH